MPVTIHRQDRGYLLECELLLLRPAEEVFGFFADATNLEAITPPQLRFEILTPLPIEMSKGAIIDQRLRLHGIPLRWRSEITAWEPHQRFVDEQRRGPYRWWIHEHTFEETDDGTLARDRVQYGVPGGAMVNALLVARDLRRIFDYRSRALRGIFPVE
ncbi:MAG: SRPBCC family protein [Phycisphaerales bacterium]|nr:MAG: SRPBCC family protein [Phycisphaerales bacterium]